MASRNSPPKAGPESDLFGRELSNAVIFFHEAIAAHLGMSAAEWKCLGLLDQHGPSPASRLADLSGFTTGAITGIVDRLERSGYVRRQPHPTDGRQVLFALTEKGLEERRRRHVAKRDWLVAAAAKLDPAQLETLAAAIPLIRRIGES